MSNLVLKTHPTVTNTNTQQLRKNIKSKIMFRISKQTIVMIVSYTLVKKKEKENA